MRALRSVFLLGSLAVLGQACHTQGPQGRPEVQCNDACNARASSRCSESECERGCRFILDRLMEHEGSHVVSCMAEPVRTAKGSSAACDDQAWADCAVRVGVHADGGPPQLPAPATDDD